jgi:hypothetical protein
VNEGPNRLVWLAIVGLAALAVVIGWTANTFFSVSLPGRDTTPIVIRVAVAPPAYDAVNAAADAYNQRNPRLESRPVTVEVVKLDGLDALKAMETARYRPTTAWVVESRWFLDGVQGSGSLPPPGFVTTGDGAPQSIARSYMIWGVYNSSADVLVREYGGISWRTLHAAGAADSSWKLIFASPGASAQGLGAVLGAAAEFHGGTAVTETVVTDQKFMNWMSDNLDLVPNIKRAGGDPAGNLAEQGKSVADAGFILESDWLRNADAIQRAPSEPITLTYPAVTVMFDFPFAVWAGASEPEQRAALDFRAFLTGEWQAHLADDGLRPPSGPANGGLFAKYPRIGVVADPAIAPVTITPGAFRTLRNWARESFKLTAP